MNKEKIYFNNLTEVVKIVEEKIVEYFKLGASTKQISEWMNLSQHYIKDVINKYYFC